MIPYNDVVFINKKLSLLIWVNVIAIGLVVTLSVLAIYFQVYWIASFVILIIPIHFAFAYHIHVKLKKHATQYRLGWPTEK